MRVTVSIGIATSLDLGVATPEHLIAKADEYLYRAKEGGRDRAEFER
jgi:PleD family two-component response regulator